MSRTGKKYQRCSAGEDRGNPFNGPGPDLGDESHLVANEIWDSEECNTDCADITYASPGSLPVSTAASGHPQISATEEPPNPYAGARLTSVINPHAVLPNYTQTQLPDTINTADSRDPREPQGPQLFDGPQTQDTVTVWVPGGDIPTPGCCTCRRYFQCGYWVAAPSFVMLLGIAVTTWVWIEHGRDADVMQSATSASGVLVGPILTFLGILGIFVACIMHEIHARRRYDPLEDDAPEEEFL